MGCVYIGYNGSYYFWVCLNLLWEFLCGWVMFNLDMGVGCLLVGFCWWMCLVIVYGLLEYWWEWFVWFYWIGYGFWIFIMNCGSIVIVVF